MRTPLTELWHIGIARRRINECTLPDGLRAAEKIWLPHPGSFRFIADPFGIWNNGMLTVFAEYLDYRIKRGEIHYYCYDEALEFQSQGIALQAPYHLSYPYVLTENGETYLLPEASKSGKLTLYRARHFPADWEPIATLLELPAIDATPVSHEGRWWLFFALPGENGRAMRELHLAYADTLTGPYTLHPQNPIRTGLADSRMGGTPFLLPLPAGEGRGEGILHLPMQNCTDGYGAAMTTLRVDTLTATEFAATPIQHLSPNNIHPDYPDGIHTLAAAGDVTLFDVKRLHPSHARRWVNMQRRLRRVIR